MSENRKKSEIERRNIPVSELRAITDDKGLRHIVGYAAVFNSLSEDLGWFVEKIDPGAFRDSIATDDIRALWNHESKYILGRNKSGTLTLAEDERGLKIDISPPDAQWAKDLMTSIDRGDVSQMSFGFKTLSDEWNLVDGKDVRTLIKVRLYDVSPVTFPAYPDTEVVLRSLEKHRKSKNIPPSGGSNGAEDGRNTVLLSQEDEAYKIIMCV